MQALMSQHGSAVSGDNKLINSIMSDMQIYENNMASFEQKMMENMRHEQTIALAKDKQDQLEQLI